MREISPNLSNCVTDSPCGLYLCVFMGELLPSSSSDWYHRVEFPEGSWHKHARKEKTRVVATPRITIKNRDKMVAATDIMGTSAFKL